MPVTFLFQAVLPAPQIYLGSRSKGRTDARQNAKIVYTCSLVPKKVEQGIGID